MSSDSARARRKSMVTERRMLGRVRVTQVVERRNVRRTLSKRTFRSRASHRVRARSRARSRAGYFEQRAARREPRRQVLRTTDAVEHRVREIETRARVVTNVAGDATERLVLRPKGRPGK